MNELRRLKRLHLNVDYAVETVSLIVLCYTFKDELNTRINIKDFYSKLSKEDKKIFTDAYEYIFELSFDEIEEIYVSYIETKNFNNLVQATGKTYGFLSEEKFLTLTMKKLLCSLKETPDNTKIKDICDYDKNHYIKLKSFEIKGKLYFLLQNSETKIKDYYEYIEANFGDTVAERLEYVKDAKVIKTLKNLTD